MAVGWCIAAVCLLCVAGVLAACKIGKAEDRNMGIDEDKVMPQTTSVPMPDPTPEPTVWVRYDVPLSDDIQKYVYEQCQKYMVSPALVYAIIENESDYQIDAVSSDGYDFGLMQIRSLCHTERCVRLGAWNLLDAKMNLRVGIDYLSELLEDNDEPHALAKYHGETGEPGSYSRTILADAAWIEETAMTMEE